MTTKTRMSYTSPWKNLVSFMFLPLIRLLMQTMLACRIKGGPISGEQRFLVESSPLCG